MTRWIALLAFLFLCLIVPAQAVPSRVQGCAAETGAASSSCTLSGVVSGHIIVVAGVGLGTSGAFSLSDNCGGTYVVLDSYSVSASSGQGYSTGSSGTCIITVTAASAAATTIVAEEITAGTAAQHTYSHNQTTTCPTTCSTVAASVTTTATDYVFSWYTDANANGGSHGSVAAPFTFRDFNNVFPIVDADATQGSSGLITATWTPNVATTFAAVGVMAFAPPAAGGPPPNLPLMGCCK
jgi:hypothetical protein